MVTKNLVFIFSTFYYKNYQTKIFKVFLINRDLKFKISFEGSVSFHVFLFFPFLDRIRIV